MISEVSICNLALFRIGHTQRIDSLTEASVAAELCNILYPIVRDRIIEAGDWSFARKRVTLASVGDPPDNWAYQYQYPSDCAKARSIEVSGLRNPHSGQRIPFEVMANTVNEGRSICCDQEQAVLVYTAAVTNTALFAPAFVNAIAWALALELVTPLARDVKFASLAAQQAPAALAEALAADMAERREDRPVSEFISVRY